MRGEADMKTKFYILAIFSFLAVSSIAQEYYYWYKGDKIVLELMPSKQYVRVSNPNDTVALKVALSEVGAKCSSFFPEVLSGIQLLEGVKPPESYFAIVERQTLPDLLKESKYFTAPVFKREVNGEVYEIAITHAVYVKLKQATDFALLDNLAKDSKVEVWGNNPFDPKLYTLSCSNASKDNPLNIANQFQEKSLFEYVEPEILTLKDNFPSSNEVVQSEPDVLITVSKSDVIIDAKGQQINVLAVYALDGTLLYSKSINNSRFSLNLATHKGVVIFKIELQSGKVLSKKVLLNN
jgi:hypothetical protein